MHLYNYRNNIINLIAKKNIKPSKFPCNAKSGPAETVEPESELALELEPELKSKPPFEESISERTKIKRQKNLMINNQTLQICLI